jgi:hypothetical protein
MVEKAVNISGITMSCSLSSEGNTGPFFFEWAITGGV